MQVHQYRYMNNVRWNSCQSIAAQLQCSIQMYISFPESLSLSQYNEFNDFLSQTCLVSFSLGKHEFPECAFIGQYFPECLAIGQLFPEVSFH